MTRVLLYFLLLQLVFTGYSSAAPQNPSMGNGLDYIRDWSTERPFKDLMKSSRPWLTQCVSGVSGCVNSWDTGEQALLDLDQNGWPRSLPAPDDPPEYWRLSTYWAFGSTFPKGRYIVFYSGDGVISYGLGTSLITNESAPGRHVIDIQGDQMLLTIESTDPLGVGDYIRDIEIVAEAWQHDYQSAPFNPTFLAKIRPFHVQRFMDWMNTNYSQEVDWADRAKPSHVRYSEVHGVPVEVMLDLANRLDNHPWFNMPHMADDNYIREFSRLVLQQLSPDLNVYVEYSNEVWNSQFPQAHWVEAQGQAAWPGAATDFELRLSWYGQRTAQICDIWKQEWAGQEQRIKCVMASQAANSWTLGQSLECPQSSLSPCVSHGIDVAAIAPYFGGYLGSTSNETQVESWTSEVDGGLQTLFDELNSGLVLGGGNGAGAVDEAFGWIDSNKLVADTYSLELAAYEGGQHMVGVGAVVHNSLITQLFNDANRDSRMGTTYNRYLQGWRTRGGGLFVNYKGIGSYSEYGSWGALEHVDQATTPKYQALMDYIAGYSSCSDSGDVTISPANANNLFTQPFLVSCNAGGTLATFGTSRVYTGADVLFRGTQITLDSGFLVEAGGEFKAKPW